MSTQVQFRRGNTAQTSTFTGASAEITVDTDKETIVVHDGSTAGGFALARESSSNTAGSYANSAYATANSAQSYANSAFATANTSAAAGSYSNSAFGVANSAASYANSGFAVANSGSSYANSAFLAANNSAGVNLTQNTNITNAGTYANSAFLVANTPSHVANSAASYANSGFAVANSGSSYANSAFITANNSLGIDLTQNTNITNAGTYANSAYTRANNSLNANTGGSITGDISITGNLTVTGNTTYTNTRTVLIADNIITVNAAIDQAAQPAVNAGIEVDRGAQPNSSFLWIETSGKWAANNGNGAIFIAADSAESYANAAFASANLNNGVNTTQNTNITNAGTYANAAFLVANTPTHVANSAASYANSAFIVANNSLGIDTTQNTNITNAGTYANSAFAAANAATATDTTQNASITAAFTAANAAFLQANTPSNVANSAASYANSAFVSANSAGVYANSAFARANNSVLKAGDTMTGTLTIPSLRGSTSGNIVTIPSGHIIKGTDSGSIVQPGSIIQTVYLRTDVKATYTIPTSTTGTSGTGVAIDDLTVQITPKYSTSKILLTYSVFFEVDQDTIIYLSRNGSNIGRNTTDSGLWSGLAVAPYDGNSDSTPATQTFFYLDSPNTTTTRTYRYIVQKSNNDAGYGFHLNRAQNSAGSNSREIGISQVLVQEIAQ